MLSTLSRFVMTKNSLRALRFVLCVLPLVAGLAPSNTHASGFVYNFVDAFSGTSPSASTAWTTATFEDVAPGTVSLTISNSGLTANEYVSGLYFNLDPTKSPMSLQFNFVSGTAGVTLPVVTTGVNFERADGDGYYDVLFSFATAASGRFNANDYFVYTITGIPGLTTADFIYLSAPAGGVGPFLAAGHVQSIGTNALSGWIAPTETTPLVPIPEPSTAALLLAAAGIIVYRHRAALT
jgi:hypothetical protein